jgi:hypothetical protein
MKKPKRPLTQLKTAQRETEKWKGFITILKNYFLSLEAGARPLTELEQAQRETEKWKAFETILDNYPLSGRWAVAVMWTEMLFSPQPLIDLLRPLVPPEGMQHVENLLKRKFGLHEQGHHSRQSWYPNKTNLAAQLVRLEVQFNNKPVDVAVDDVAALFNSNPKTIKNYYQKKFSPNKDRQKD